MERKGRLFAANLCDPEQQLTRGKDVQSGMVIVPEPHVRETGRCHRAGPGGRLGSKP